MNTYKGLSGREDLIAELTEKYSTKSAETLTFIQAGRGQGKSHIINELLHALLHKKFNIFLSYGDELRAINTHDTLKKINAFGLSGGIADISLGFSVGWNNSTSQYEKIRSMFTSFLKKDILLCVDDIEDISDELRLLVFQIIKNIQRLESDYHKKIFILITSTLEPYSDTVFKDNVSTKIIKLPNYEANDIGKFFEMQKKLMKVDIDKIYDLCHGNLNLADFLYNEIGVQNNDYLDTLNDVVNRRLAIIKDRGERKELSSIDTEDIIFSASLAIKKFSAQLLKNIIEKNMPLITQGLDIACEEALLEKDIRKYYSFISDEIQEYIAKISTEKREDLLISYYNYYTQNEPDEYYIRAHYIYKYQGYLSDLSEALFLLAYSFAKKISDDQKVSMIEGIFFSGNIEGNRRSRFEKIKNFYDDILNEADLSKVASDYDELQSELFDITVLAEISCEYFGLLYRKTPMNTPTASHILNKCIEYAKNELILGDSEVEGLIQTDEKILRLKIIYDIAPCVLDQRNDYETFQKLYNLSKELTNNKINKRQKSIGEYIENVFNRKAFLFVNPASCDVYYEKAKNYFGRHEIWLEYYITLVCQAGTYIVIQEFQKAIDMCQKVRKECEEREIQLPQIEKLQNNETIAEFLLIEQCSKSMTKIKSAAKKALSNLKKLINKETNATQFVIYTNICSLCLYIDDRKQYNKYKNKLEKIYKCNNIAEINDESIDDFYRYYFAWFELYCAVSDENWDSAEKIADSLKGFIPALFRKQEIFWEAKIAAVKTLIINREKKNAYDFCNNLVQTKRHEQILSKFFYRGLMISDLQYTSYF